MKCETCLGTGFIEMKKIHFGPLYYSKEDGELIADVIPECKKITCPYCEGEE